MVFIERYQDGILKQKDILKFEMKYCIGQKSLCKNQLEI